MYKLKYFCVLLLLWLPIAIGKAQLPSYLNICKRDDPHLYDCIKSSMDNLKPHMAKGIPEMRIPAFDPFHFVRIGYDSGTVKLNFLNADLGLAHQFETERVHVDMEACTVSMSVYFPLLLISGNYELVGKLFLLDLDGKGTVTGNITSGHISFVLSCNRELENGEEYMKFKDVDLKVKIEDVKLQLNDIFKNNKQLTDITNAAINDNSKALAADFGTFMAKAVGETVLHIGKQVFDRFSIDVLLPK